jgi:hypothetical protein
MQGRASGVPHVKAPSRSHGTSLEAAACSSALTANINFVSGLLRDFPDVVKVGKAGETCLCCGLFQGYVTVSVSSGSQAFYQLHGGCGEEASHHHQGASGFLGPG